MKSKVDVGRVFGIRIQIHWTFLLIIVWAIYVGWNRGGTIQSMFWSTAFILAIFCCVVLHELGHALTARRYGIKTRRITLLPIGGVASLERMPEKPYQELIVAVMGPVVNVIIAILLFPFIQSQLNILQRPEEAEVFFQTVTAGNFFVFLFFTNIALVVFNLIPAFPMDGGRVLRALLSFKMDRVRATQIAAGLGQIIAILFFLLGFSYNPILIFISLFVFLGASGEYMMVRHLNLLRGHKVREAMMTNYSVFDPQDRLDKVGQTLLDGTESQFLVLQDDGTIAGVLARKSIVEAFQSTNKELSVGDIMDNEFVTVQADADLSELYRMAQRRKQLLFPVMEENRVVGVIDMENINEFVMIQANLDY